MDRTLDFQIRGGRLRRGLLLLASLVLLGGVVWTITRERDHFQQTWASVRGGAWWLLVIWFLAPAMNWVFSSQLAWALLRPQPLVDRDERAGQPRLTRPEMYEVIGTAWLANLLPLRAGLLSRTAYHAKVNRIPLATVVRSIIVSIVLGGIMSLGLVLLCYGAGLVALPAWALAVAIVMPYPLLRLAGASLPVADPGRWWTGGFGRWRVLDAGAARYADMLVWMVRYWVAFALVGHQVTLAQAVVFAACSQLVMLVPLPGNALGMRELVVGWLAPLVPSAIGQGASLAQLDGRTADLANRLPEVGMTLVVGGVCSALLAQRSRFRAD